MATTGDQPARPAASASMQIESTANDRPIDATITSEIDAARFRIYTSTRWLMPIGTLANCIVVLLALRDRLPLSRLLIWFGCMVAITAIVIAAFAVPLLARRRDRSGLPFLARPAHVAFGVVEGALLWISPEATDDPLVMWMIGAAMFGISAGLATGMPGLNDLSLGVLVPMWLIAGAALLVAGEFVPGFGVAVYLGLIIRNEGKVRELWKELFVLRMRDRQQAEFNAWRAEHDDLTGLLNRAGVTRRVQLASEPRTAMFIDLDHFKETNDRLGHAAGDTVLQEVARRLKKIVRDTDHVARIGGDEFYIVFDRELTDAQARSIGSSMIDSLEEPFLFQGDEEIWISASIGFASWEGDEADASRLLIEADHAMLHAKRRGRRQVAAFTQGLADELAARSGLESALRKAVRDRDLECAAQPVFDLATGSVVAVELLARWTLESGAAVPPSVFIPLAEEVGLIDELTEHMFDRAGALLQQWKSEPLLRAARISVNVSPVQIAKGRLLDVVAEVVHRYGVEPGRLMVELTESATLNEMGSTVGLFEELRTLGIGLALDDFGTGYSSLSHLLALPLTAVKVDRSLISGIDGDTRQRAIIMAVCDLARVVGHVVIAEGIENSREAETLLSMGVTAGQGFGLLRPVPVDDLVEHLALAEPSLTL